MELLFTVLPNSHDGLIKKGCNIPCTIASGLASIIDRLDIYVCINPIAANCVLIFQSRWARFLLCWIGIVSITGTYVV